MRYGVMLCLLCFASGLQAGPDLSVQVHAEYGETEVDHVDGNIRMQDDDRGLAVHTGLQLWEPELQLLPKVAMMVGFGRYGEMDTEFTEEFLDEQASPVFAPDSETSAWLGYMEFGWEVGPMRPSIGVGRAYWRARLPAGATGEDRTISGLVRYGLGFAVTEGVEIRIVQQHIDTLDADSTLLGLQMTL